MKTLNFEEFELNNESLDKVTGGIIVRTKGFLLKSQDVWCDYDGGDSNDQTMGGFDCCKLASNGFCL